MLHYKGYSGTVDLDPEAAVFHGEVLDLRDVVTFEGRSVEDVERAFRDSIDDYLEMCAERGEQPDRPFSGRLMVRLSPDLHRELYVRARAEGKSLNRWISDRLGRAV
jgi:predicted HicB family RNase H-like nuclease